VRSGGNLTGGRSERCQHHEVQLSVSTGVEARSRVDPDIGHADFVRGTVRCSRSARVDERSLRVTAVAGGRYRWRPSDQTTLATLTEQSQRLHRLVGDLSAVSRAEERQLNLHAVLVPAQDLVSGAITAARPRFDAKGISLTLEATVVSFPSNRGGFFNDGLVCRPRARVGSRRCLR
jgi:signal transduction histidine kinase